MKTLVIRRRMARNLKRLLRKLTEMDRALDATLRRL